MKRRDFITVNRHCIGTPIGVRPLKRTGLRGGFDRLPGVVLLELSRTQIAEGGVEPARVLASARAVGALARPIPSIA